MGPKYSKVVIVTFLATLRSGQCKGLYRVTTPDAATTSAFGSKSIHLNGQYLRQRYSIQRMDITWDGTLSTSPIDRYRRDHGHVHHATPLSPPQEHNLVAGSISELHRYGIVSIALHVLFSLSNTASRFRRQHHLLGTSVNNLALQVMHYRAKPKPEVHLAR